MDAKTLYTLLIIVGGFLMVLLTINSFFLRDILKNLAELKLVFTKLNTEHSIYSDLVKKHEKEIEKCRDRLHDLEGSINTVAANLGLLKND